ncbi:MAG: hypothetical protein ABIH50_00195 [bacterium]
MAEVKADGGGLHPGKPVLWPTGKASSSPVSNAAQAETAGGVRGVPSRGAPTKPGEVSAPTGPQAGVPVAPPKPAPSVARPLTIEDIRSHLLSQQIEANDFNTKLASLMLRNGLELSQTNFVKVMTMIQGSDKSQSMQEAAVLLLMKGIDDPSAAKVLGQYFTENPALAAKMISMQGALGNLNSAMGMGKGLFDSALLSQLSAILAQFDSTFQSITEKGATKAFNRGNTINDVRALKALLQGLQQKAPAGSEEAKALSAALREFQGKLDSVMQNLLAQAILSQSGRQEVNYHYQQIPNAMTNPPKDFEIVIKRDGEGKQANIDPRNTQVVMSMETENMGKMVVSMIVKDNKVYVIFVFNEKEYGEEGRNLIAKDFGDFQQKLANKNFLITGYQVKVDSAMCNIKPYLIPMLPGLDDLLRKIDIEA